MMLAIKVALVATIGAICAHGHATYYKVNRALCFSGEPPPIYSYHLHVLFNAKDKLFLADAYELQAKILKRFNITEDCKNLYHQDQMCSFGLDIEPGGPFPTSQFAIFFRPDQYQYVVPYISVRRERKGRFNKACINANITDPACGFNYPSFDIVVHPNTGCEYEDHGKWGVWGGNVQVLNLAVMDTENPFVNGDADPYDGDGPMPTPIQP